MAGGGNIPARFEDIAGRYAQLEAIRSPQSVLSYQDLEKSSRHLAGALCQKLGTEPQPVALLMKDGAQMIASLLGVVRAGHFYCALSHRDPTARLAKVLLDLDTKLLITDSQSLPQAQQVIPHGCEILLISDIPETEETRLPTIFAPETPLGVFYTSGSTGEPKGVLRTHSYILHRLGVDVRDYGICAGDRLLYMRLFNVSSSLSSIFDVLLTGATIVIYDANAQGIGPLAELLDREKITIFVPPIEFLRYFLDSLERNTRFDSIRVVILGGDVLFRRDVECLRPHIPERAVIIHHLSSSEAGLLARSILHSNSPVPADIVPLGFPVPEKEVLILDQEGKLLLNGTTGEIAVRSSVIFPGYWRQPDLSASMFRPDPANLQRNVFCTGDLGYFLPDGQLVFLGRKDFRVKIRGFSVDCASVESALMSDPQVKRAVVVPQVDPTGHKRLVAYVLISPDSPVCAASLRSYLLERIPDYMIPSVFMFPAELPLTASMKVDRKALLPPDWSQAQTATQFVAPMNETEQKLALLWQAVLGVERVGIDDPFFDIGGDSLLAMSLVHEIEQVLGVLLPVRTLIDHETIRKMAILLQDLHNTNLDILVPYSKKGSGLPVFLASGGGDVMGLFALAHQLEGRQPVYGLQAAGIGRENLYKLPVEKVAARFVSAIRAVQPTGPYRLIGGSAGGLVAYAMASILAKAGESVSLLGLIDTTPPGPRPMPGLGFELRRIWWRARPRTVKVLLQFFGDWGKEYLFELARRNPFRKLFTIKILDAIRGMEDIEHPGRSAHLLYHPGGYDQNVIFFKATIGQDNRDWDYVAGWEKFLKGGLQVVEVEGDHGQIFRNPCVAGLAKAIKPFLE